MSELWCDRCCRLVENRRAECIANIDGEDVDTVRWLCCKCGLELDLVGVVKAI